MSASTDPVPWLSPTELAAWRGLRRLDPVVLAAISHDLHCDSGLSDADYEILTHVSEAEERRLPFAELERRTRWSSSRLSHQVRRMCERGLLGRAADPEDARSSIVELTDAGWTAIDAAAPLHLRSVRRHLLDALDAEEVEQLAAITARLLAHHAVELD